MVVGVRDEDLAIEVAKQKLAVLKERAGYAEAMRKVPPAKGARLVTLAGAAACGGIIYACTLYVTAAWLRWFFIVIFVALGVLMLLATIGFSPSLAPTPWGVAILEKRIADHKHLVKFLREDGGSFELAVSESTYQLLKAGDLGVLKTTGGGPDYSVDSFQRL